MLSCLKRRGAWPHVPPLFSLASNIHRGPTGMAAFMKEYVGTRGVPIPELLCAFNVMLCEELQKKKPPTLRYFLQVVLSRELQARDRLLHWNTINDAVFLIRTSKRILVLTGAGISVSCGIPDFRSHDGLYAQLKEAGEYDLDDPQEMFDINYFRTNPAGTSFAKQIYPSNFTPSPCHRFIKLIEDKGKHQNYTQNIDTLERLTGVQNVLQCHGSFATASCLACRVTVPGAALEPAIFGGKIPLCAGCVQNAENAPAPARTPATRTMTRRATRARAESEEEESAYPPWIMKPDITFFGEKLTDNFEKALAADRERVDLILVIGTSLKVSPVSEILTHLPHNIPQILINKTPVRHINPDIILLGNADPIVEHLCARLNWDLPPPLPVPAPSEDVPPPPLPRTNSKKRRPESGSEPERVADSHIWLFEGAEGGKWLEDVRAALEGEEEEEEEEEDEEDEPPLRVVSRPSVVKFGPPPQSHRQERETKKARIR
ncbi:DHS-like NAD/FAD-binding domain-containing protein [Amylostereum chailletii]|nr:DHS-like NAD/FAD-binding domain-containing protein [Amylostereum chailletii]